jgi:hypothetical protein
MKHFKYLKYLLRHKWYVTIECFKRGLYWQGITHDLSKLLPSEFFPYAEYFYGNYKSREYFDLVPIYGCMEMVPYGLCVSDKFYIAWNYHQKRNKHHWQYWLLKNDDGDQFSVGMPKKYLIEMLCDWIGAGKAIHGKNDTKKWYMKNKQNIILREKDRKFIENELNLL